jgi:hypothetical protein
VTAPLDGLHASVVQALLSLTLTGVPLLQLPVEPQVSLPLHAFPSVQLVPAALLVWVTAPVVVLQVSVVQGLPSSTTTGVPGWQAPVALQSSAPVHALLSVQLVPLATGLWVMPVPAAQASVVQGLLSFRFGAVPATQVPVELQVSAPLHTLASAQLVPEATGVWTTPVPVTKLSVVQGLPSSIGGIVHTVAPPPEGA